MAAARRGGLPLHRRRGRSGGRGRARRPLRRGARARPPRATHRPARARHARGRLRRPRGLHRRCPPRRRPHHRDPQGVIPEKRLGQHFLRDPGILGKIVDALDPTPEDVVIEIGAGKGSLTAILAARVRSVIAIEKDRRLAHDCRLRIADCGFGNAEVVEGDALKLDWHTLLDARHVNPQSAIHNPHSKVVGNIPYSITSPLIEKALTPPLPERIVFLVQREVADRLAAQPGSRDYGALTVGVQATCRVEKLFTVQPGAFRPAPRVDSALVRLSPLEDPLVPAEQAARFRRFVTTCFTRRRKQLRNVVMAATGQPAATVLAGLEQLGMDPAARPETLPPEAFVRLLRWRGGL